MPRLNEHVVRLITVRYWSGLIIIALAITASYALLGWAIQTERKGMAIVDLAAEQGFATQRICFLSHAVINSGDEEAREYFRNSLRETVQKMERHHDILSLRRRAGEIPPQMRSTLRKVYYGEPHAFDQEISKLLREANAILNAGDEELGLGMKALSRLTEAGSRGVVETQRRIFNELRSEATAAVDRIRMLGGFLWLLTLALLAVEVPLIFRPTARRAGRILRYLEKARQRAESDAASAQAAREGQAAFIRTMSHDLRTPLTAILGMTQLMKMGVSPEKQSEYTRDIHDAGRHLLDLINDILELSRLEAGQVTIEPRHTSLQDELEWTVSLLRPLAAEKNLNLSYRYDFGLARYYLADGPRIRQILVNLVGNALKFTEEGSIVVSATYAGSAGDAADLVRFEVKDTGIGVPAGMRQRIFDEFQQADNSLARKYGGSGLGLAICSRLVKLMNGEIGVESSEGSGSVFWFYLPLQWVVEPYPGEQTPVRPGVGSRLHVLVAEADPVARALIQRRLNWIGHEVATAASGSEAIAAVMETPPDVILMAMAEEETVAAIRAIRELPGLAVKPFIIALSARDRHVSEERIIDAGADLCLGKPLDFEVLRRHLAERSSGATG